MMLLTLFIEFFKIGLFSFGGGTAMLPLIYQAIQPFGVMSVADFSDMVALSQVTPGPVAINAATFVGLKFAGLPGTVVATIAICIPCFVIMLIVMKLLEKFRGNAFVEGAKANQEMLEKANEEGISVVETELPIYEAISKFKEING